MDLMRSPLKDATNTSVLSPIKQVPGGLKDSRSEPLPPTSLKGEESFDRGSECSFTSAVSNVRYLGDTGESERARTPANKPTALPMNTEGEFESAGEESLLGDDRTLVVHEEELNVSLLVSGLQKCQLSTPIKVPPSLDNPFLRVHRDNQLGLDDSRFDIDPDSVNSSFASVEQKDLENLQEPASKLVAENLSELNGSFQNCPDSSVKSADLESGIEQSENCTSVPCSTPQSETLFEDSQNLSRSVEPTADPEKSIPNYSVNEVSVEPSINPSPKVETCNLEALLLPKNHLTEENLQSGCSQVLTSEENNELNSPEPKPVFEEQSDQTRENRSFEVLDENKSVFADKLLTVSENVNTNRCISQELVEENVFDTTHDLLNPVSLHDPAKPKNTPDKPLLTKHNSSENLQTEKLTSEQLVEEKVSSINDSLYLSLQEPAKPENILNKSFVIELQSSENLNTEKCISQELEKENLSDTACVLLNSVSLQDPVKPKHISDKPLTELEGSHNFDTEELIEENVSDTIHDLLNPVSLPETAKLENILDKSISSEIKCSENFTAEKCTSQEFVVDNVSDTHELLNAASLHEPSKPVTTLNEPFLTELVGTCKGTVTNQTVNDFKKHDIETESSECLDLLSRPGNLTYIETPKPLEASICSSLGKEVSKSLEDVPLPGLSRTNNSTVVNTQQFLPRQPECFENLEESVISFNSSLAVLPCTLNKDLVSFEVNKQDSLFGTFSELPPLQVSNVNNEFVDEFSVIPGEKTSSETQLNHTFSSNPSELNFSDSEDKNEECLLEKTVILVSEVAQSVVRLPDSTLTKPLPDQAVPSGKKFPFEPKRVAMDNFDCLLDEAPPSLESIDTSADYFHQETMRELAQETPSNSSEAGPVTADESFTTSTEFPPQAPVSDLDLDILIRKGGKRRPPSRLARQSLFTKFDPLVSNSPQSMDSVEEGFGEVERREDLETEREAGVSGDGDSTPVKTDSGSEMLIPVTPYQPKNLHPPAHTPRSKKPESTPNTLIRQEMLSKEISKLQGLMVQQEQSYESQMHEKTEMLQRAEEKIEDLVQRLAQFEMGGGDSIESQLKNLKTKNEDLTKECSQRTKENTELLAIIDEYEKFICQLVSKSETEKTELQNQKKELEKDRDSALTHLANLEVGFNDIHQKYEKSKAAIEQFKKNEEILQAGLKESAEKIQLADNQYRKLRDHAKQKLDEANQEFISLRKGHEAELARTQAIIKKYEISMRTLENTVTQKDKEIKELTKICDELIGKLNN